MFYSQFILAKKGPLGTIWIAAHLERKLRKNQITETNISASVDSILFPEVPIALRLSGHLLLGVVRIYSRKVNYLFHDCSEALVKIKHAFHTTSVDLPPEASTAPFRSITLPDTFDFDELEVYLKRDNDLRAAVREIVDHNVSARDLITLRDKTDDQADYPFPFAQDEGFPEVGDPYSVLLYSEEEFAHEGPRVSAGNPSLTQEKAGQILEEDVLPPLQMDDEMDLGRTNIDDEDITPRAQIMTPGDQDGMAAMELDLDTRLGCADAEALQESLIPPSTAEQPPMPTSNVSISIDGRQSVPMSLPMPDTRSKVPDVEKLRSAIESKEPEPLFMELEEDMGLNKDAVESSRHKISIADYDMEINEAEATPILKETPISTRPPSVTVDPFGDFHDNEDLLATILGGRTPALKVMGTPSETPASTLQKRGRAKRKSVFDDVVILSSILMKKQLANTDDLRRKRRKIPLTEFELWKQQGSYNDQKFARPSVPGLCSDIRDLYTRVMTLPALKPLVTLPLGKATVNVQTCEGSTHVNRIAELDSVEAADMSTRQTLVETPAISPVQPSEEEFAFQTLEHVHRAQSPQLSPVRNNEKIQEPVEPFVSVPEPVAAEEEPCDNVVEDGKITRKTDYQEAAYSEELLPEAASEQTLENLVFLADPQDRVFLAPDEEEVLEEADVNHHKKGKLVQDKNGWSLRTKSVAQYLKTAFEKLQSREAEIYHVNKLSLDSLLKGRTRKEAARMYFETLVLTSKDYIHAEQSAGFADIMLSGTDLLRKEVF